jgi:hypothetical protein
MTTNPRKRQRKDTVKSEDGSRVASKRKKRSAPAWQSTKPPAASKSRPQKRVPSHTSTPPQSKPQRRSSNHNEANNNNNKATSSRISPELHLSPLSSAETRPGTPRRPLALAQPNTPPIPHEVWAKILYDADFGSKVCEQFEYRQRHRPAKYGDLVVQAFPTLTPPEARELFWAAQTALKWREVRRKWQEKLDTVMSLTPGDGCHDDGC